METSERRHQGGIWEGASGRRHLGDAFARRHLGGGIWEEASGMEASGRRHLEGGIWEDHGKDFGKVLGGALTGGIWEKASGKRHLGRGIWEEASEGRYLGGALGGLWVGSAKALGVLGNRATTLNREVGSSTGKPGTG